MAARQFVKIWKESATGQGSTYGVDPFVPPGSPALNTDFIVPHLVSDGAFNMRKAPNQVEMRSWNALNRRIKTISQTYAVAGQLVTYCYAEQAGFFANSLNLNVTTNNLPSFVIDHAQEMNDDTSSILYNRYLGCKVNSYKLECSADSQVATITVGFVGQRTQTTVLTSLTFPEPTWNQYPVTKPYTFTDLSTPGWFKTSNTSRAEFNGISIDIENILDSSMNEKAYVTRIKHCGRNISFTNSFVHVSNSDRAAFEAATELSNTSIKFDNGVNSLSFAFGPCVVTGVEDELALDKISRQNVTFVSQFDGFADLTITASSD